METPNANNTFNANSADSANNAYREERPSESNLHDLHDLHSEFKKLPFDVLHKCKQYLAERTSIEQSYQVKSA